MSLEFEIPAVSLVFIILLSLFYFSKPKIKLVENKYFSAIIIFSLLESLLSVIAHIITGFYPHEIILSDYHQHINIINRFVSTFFVAIFLCLFIYILLISFESMRKKEKTLRIIGIIFVIIFFLITSFTEIEIIRIGNVTNIRGSTIILGYVFVFVFLVLSLLTSLINARKMDMRYLSIYVIIPVLVLLYFLTILLPGMILYDFSLALLCYIMYFTIENPDLKLLRESETAKLHAEKSNRAKSDFLSSMSHEIRTPLNAIVGLTEDNMTHNDEVPQIVKENNEDIFNASQTLLEIVGNILDINRIESEKLEVNPTSYNIREEVDKICKMQSSRIGEKPIQFYQSIAEDVPVELIGDKVLIKQVLNNLLSNAIKYTEEGQVKVDINSINRGDDATLIINVSDTGRGIKKEYIDKLFTKFERLDVEKNSTTQGTGLGLAITKSYVEMMGGKINAQSDFGKGSVFMVTLPQKIGKQDVDLTKTQVLKLYNANNRVEAENKEEITNVQIPEEAIPDLPIQKQEVIENNNNDNVSKRKVLIVDDNNLNRKVASRAIDGLGFEIDEATSGEECLNKIKEKQYDLILMDIMMPGMSGDETLLKLKEDPNFNIPVIAVTADVESGSEKKYLGQGFTSYIGKPFTKDQIKVEIDKIFK